MDEGALLHPLPPRQFQQRPQVVDMRMDASVGDESEQVHIRAALLRPLERLDECFVLEERPVRNGAVHPLEILVEDTSRTDSQVPDLGVAHLAGRQADGLAGGSERRMRVARPERVEDRRLGLRDSVPRPGRGAAPPVEDDKRYEGESRAAVSQIAVNDSTSSEAPPTSAPSTWPCASSASAFSGFTEPP